MLPWMELVVARLPESFPSECASGGCSRQSRMTRRLIVALSVLTFPRPARPAVLQRSAQPTGGATLLWLTGPNRQRGNPDETAFVWQAVIELLGFAGLPSPDTTPDRVQTEWLSTDETEPAATIILPPDRGAAGDLFRVTVDVMPSRRLRRDMVRVHIGRMVQGREGQSVLGAPAQASAANLERRILDRAFALRSNARQADPNRWPLWPDERERPAAR